jgi:hypothetical protein
VCSREPRAQRAKALRQRRVIGVQQQVQRRRRVVLRRVPRPFAQHVQAPQVALDLAHEQRPVYALAGVQRTFRLALEFRQPPLQEGTHAITLGAAGQRHVRCELEAAGRDGGIGVLAPERFEEGLGQLVEAGVLSARDRGGEGCGGER